MTLQMLGSLERTSTVGTHANIASCIHIVTHSLSLVWSMIVVRAESHVVTYCRDSKSLRGRETGQADGVMHSLSWSRGERGRHWSRVTFDSTLTHDLSKIANRATPKSVYRG